ncbi:MAG TPA: IS630 family transposase [Mucilaginibacter sp.]|nr:IS630 family transposase [Mucilaginibacter sp.]
MAHAIDLSLKKIIRQRYIDGTLVRNALARELQITRGTVMKYELECREVEKRYPYKLNNLGFWIRKKFLPHKRLQKYHELMKVIADLVDRSTMSYISALNLWPEYRKLCPGGYLLGAFAKNLKAWRLANNISVYHHRRVREIAPGEFLELKKWSNCFERKKWQRATIILESFQGKNVHDTAEKVDLDVPIVLKWIDIFKEQGIKGLTDRPYTLNPERKEVIKTKQANISKLIHESPRLHGLNRTSWTLELLTLKYKEIYKQSITPATISVHLHLLGYGYRKSRERITSPDAQFREKVDHIKNILANLKEEEKFFSIDEFGHFAIKLKGGWSHVKRDEQVIIPQKQKKRGIILMTAALEISTNQLTHFYSREKNTGEMIKLIGILMQQYQSASRLYISWDAAAWHRSNKLNEKIAEWNNADYLKKNKSPVIELAPLPSSAQFLNLIESVFSGMARAIIHNSNYKDVDDCKGAIDRYMEERNAHFRKNPHRAGKYLWGLEKIKPVFDEANNCKTRVRLRKD